MSYIPLANQLYHMKYSYFNWLPRELCDFIFNTFLNINEEETKHDVLPINNILKEDIDTLAKLKHEIQQLELRIDILKRNNYQYYLQYVDNVMKQIKTAKEYYDKAFIIFDETDGIRNSGYKTYIDIDKFRNKNLFVYNEIVKKYLIYIDNINIFMEDEGPVYTLIEINKREIKYPVIFVNDDMKSFQYSVYDINVDYGDIYNIYYHAYVYAMIIEFKD